MAKFNPSRVTGGTIELVRNPDGSYKSQVTGFNKIASLNLPNIKTTAATTTSDATKTAAEKAQEDLKTQTSTAFKMSPAMQKNQDDQTDFSGDMTKEAQQTSKLLTDTFKEPIEIKSPTDVFYDDMPVEQTTTQVNQADLGDTGSPISDILNEATVTTIAAINTKCATTVTPNINHDAKYKLKAIHHNHANTCNIMWRTCKSGICFSGLNL